MKFYFLFVLSVLLFGCSENETETPEINEEPAVEAIVPGRSSFTVNQIISGATVARRVHVVAPASLNTDKKYPVFFAFHGAGGEGLNFTNNPNFHE